MVEKMSEMSDWDNAIQLWIRKPNAFLKCISSCKYDPENGERTLFPKSDKHGPLIEAINHDLGKNEEIALEWTALTEIPPHPAQKKNWLESILLPKLSSIFANGLSENTAAAQGFPETLSLVDKPRYQEIYNRMKSKYGLDLVKDWPEVTDPQKFVFEDIAIASYLLALWERLDVKDAKFVDLGCGNGLLVHLLNLEGHSGYGIDIRKRAIWSNFPTSKLVERPVLPEESFPESNWILGNHTDELTPWVPIIAARSNASFWLLPCCMFDLFGKWNNSGQAKSQYLNYLSFVRSICELGDGTTQWDAMRIPSTKRICFVGKSGSVTPRLEEFIEEKRNKANKGLKNCQNLDKSKRDEFIGRIVKDLESSIARENPSLSISTLVDNFTAEEKGLLKSECGGFQTLIKNNKQLFHVQIFHMTLPLAL
ncbi:Oidioi.mRNA.OKI2018_I69.PAR.g12181.t1.cds [Oikopleura dioica]|uniref:tRNA (uracil-O(2)-)-methyltransferase n=1 Tax=Oikopleura dioica TaxID=34765 RepID=A0ABN7RYY2_OIKDI|nr:Oidioi.mRNA.OKI2018_I69.PAR.g12181.t1.cds [Oikopleura dioica]